MRLDGIKLRNSSVFSENHDDAKEVRSCPGYVVTYLDLQRVPVYMFRICIPVAIQRERCFCLWGKLPQNLLERLLAGHNNLHRVQ